MVGKDPVHYFKNCDCRMYKENITNKFIFNRITLVTIQGR